ncbi:hypothetical protein ACFPRL_34400 [Pseudoclavibacter helvolus]
MVVLPTPPLVFTTPNLMSRLHPYPTDQHMLKSTHVELLSSTPPQRSVVACRWRMRPLPSEHDTGGPYRRRARRWHADRLLVGSLRLPHRAKTARVLPPLPSQVDRRERPPRPRR